MGVMIMERAQHIVAWLMNRTRVNHVQPDVRHGVPVFVKRRRPGARIVIWFANRFLALARSGTCMFDRVDEWVAWEIHCARLLYPDRPAVTVESGRAVVVPRAPGASVRALLQRGDADVTNALVLAARELRRVHQIPCGRYGAAWSHGDLHLDNIICDMDKQRAVLIDFDTRHEFGIDPTRRHSDDVMVGLLELLKLPDDRWPPLAAAFIEAYGDETVLRELGRQLSVPRGVARLLWYVRTNGLSVQQGEQRLPRLRQIVRAATMDRQ